MTCACPVHKCAVPSAQCLLFCCAVRCALLRHMKMKVETTDVLCADRTAGPCDCAFGQTFDSTVQEGSALLTF